MVNRKQQASKSRLPQTDLLPKEVRTELDRMLPADITRDRLKQGDSHWLCWKCGAPRLAREFPSDEDIVCTHCVPSIMRWVDTSVQRNSGEVMGNILTALRRRSGPANALGVEKLLDILDSEKKSLPEMVLGIYKDAENADIEDREKLQLDALKLMQRQIEKRDEALYGQNRFDDVDPKDLIAAGLENTVDEMNMDREFMTRAVAAMIYRVEGFLEEVLRQSSAGEIIEGSVLGVSHDE
jgi:hypothetical protein